MTCIENDFKLDLFTNSHQFDASPVLNKALQLLQDMVELDYMSMSVNGLQFTTAGIQYLEKEHNRFSQLMADKKISSDFLQVLAYLGGAQAKKSGADISKKFSIENLKMCDAEPNYNEIIFSEKANKESEVMEN